MPLTSSTRNFFTGLFTGLKVALTLVITAGLLATFFCWFTPVAPNYSQLTAVVETGANVSITSLAKISDDPRPFFKQVIQSEANPDFALNPSGEAYNPSHDLKMQFGKLGVNFGSWQLTLAGYSFAEAESGTLPEVTPVIAANRAEYRRSNLTEWYVNGLWGVQQGFTLYAPPPGSPQSWLELKLNLINATAERDGQNQLKLKTRAGQSLTYSDLAAWDATGRRLPVQLENSADGQVIRLLVNSQGAVYPLTVDPYLEKQKLNASAPANGDTFGMSVALNGAGDLALVGAPGRNVAQGAVYVFTKNITSGTWTQSQVLTATDGQAGVCDPDLGCTIGDKFGTAIALNSTGTLAIIGASNKNSGQGGAYIFTRTGTTWSQAQIITASTPAANDNFGYAVALNGAGDTALIGAYGNNNYQGIAYVFTASNGLWSQAATLAAPNGAGLDYFGYAVALNGAGDTALIGASLKNNNNGAAYVFSRTNNSWAFAQILTPTNPTSNDRFGSAVALNSAGNVALVAAPTRNTNIGATYVFTRTGGNTTWNQAQMLTASDGQAGTCDPDLGCFGGDRFGTAVALNGAGDTALIGAAAKSSGLSNAGGAYIFTRTGTTWSEAQIITASDLAVNDNFGSAVALDSLGVWAFIGAPAKNSSQGILYAYSSGKTPSTLTLTSSAVTNTINFGQSVTFTATVAPLSASGIVTFTFDGTINVTATVVNGVATYVTNTLSVGSHTIVANYSGDTFLNPSTSNTLNLLVRGATTLSLAANPNPSVVGQSVTFTATVTPLSATGTVTFTLDGSVKVPVTLVNGVATYVTNTLTVGQHTLDANYGGDVNYLGSSAIQLILTVNKVASSLTLAANPNPVLVGTNITFTATVTPITATGTVTFTLDSSTKVTATVTNGIATYVTNTLSLGSHTLDGIYSGDATRLGSTATQITVVVTNKLLTTLTLTANPNPATVGQSVTFTATVTPITATGLVTFTFNGITNTTANLVNGVATYITNGLAIGVYTVTAAYGGDATYAGSTSNLLTQTIVAACNPLVVTLATDNGQASLCGTFSYALVSASAGTTITFALVGGNLINFTGSLTPTVRTGVVIDGGASGVVLNGSNVPGDGLRLAGNNLLTDLTIQGFAGRELVTIGGGNRLIRVKIFAQVCSSSVVTSPTDNGLGTTAGTLSYALATANGCTNITFALPTGNTVIFTGSLLPNVPTDVSIDGGPNGVVLEGNGVSGDGLRLSGNNNLSNLTIKSFAGRELVINGVNTRLFRVVLID